MTVSLAKLVMIVFSIFYLLLGTTCLGLGIWIVVSKSELFRFINVINYAEISSAANQHGLFLAAGYILIITGSSMLLVGCCGYCGAIKESKHLLAWYVILMGLGLGVEVAVAVIAGVFQNHVRTSSELGMFDLQDRMFVAMPDYQNGQISEDKKTVTMLINYLQIKFECCGAVVPGDIALSSSFLESNGSYDGRQLTFPVTCCQVRQDQKPAVLNSRGSIFDSLDRLNSTLVDADCPFTGNTLHTKTCISSIVSFSNRHAVPIIVIASLVAFCEVIGVVIACCLIRDINSKRLVV
ncbi:hypothetical protein BOX15_Mlig013217g2 [Macrostomum lignano]|uniref:Tetraspanin n=1 Tax=Macrostomum lignano TaxID=282301 RepID=A0A267G2K2_9PLAT|nr:hypothetical protein BOX15_Mlig013217g2 [Macrostomum lignano]